MRAVMMLRVSEAGGDVLEKAGRVVLAGGRGLGEEDILACLELPASRLPALLGLAHAVRRRWCGDAVAVEGIVSVKTAGCPEDCHFCSQSGVFDSPVRAARLDVGGLVRAAREARVAGAGEFCIVAAVRGPDEPLLAQVRAAIGAIRTDGNDVLIACSLGILSRAQAAALAAMGVRRYNHNLETARSFFPSVVTTHTWEERYETLRLAREAGMGVCCGGILGMGESTGQRAEFAAQLAALEPDEVPLNFLDPRPGTPLAGLPVLPAGEALRVIAAFRLAMPRITLRLAGGRERALGGDGTRDGLLGGVNALITGNYLTTLGRAPAGDLALLGELGMPARAPRDGR